MEVQRTTKRFDDGHGNYVGLRLLLLLAAVIVAARDPFSHKRTDDKEQEARGENTLSFASCMDTELHCVLST